MTPPRRCTAIKASLSLALLFIASAASAESIGIVTRLEGVLVASRADGSVKVLGVDSAIEPGDILSSRKQTYVAVTLADNSTVTLGPDTDLKIERYVFHKHVPDGDGATLALANGSVRVTAGILGTRGSGRDVHTGDTDGDSGYSSCECDRRIRCLRTGCARVARNIAASVHVVGLRTGELFAASRAVHASCPYRRPGARTLRTSHRRID